MESYCLSVLVDKDFRKVYRYETNHSVQYQMKDLL